MSLRLIPLGEIAAILLVVTPGLVGEMDDIILVVTPGLEWGIGEGSAAALDVLALVVEAPTDLELFILHLKFGSVKLLFEHVKETKYYITFVFSLFWMRWWKFLF